MTKLEQKLHKLAKEKKLLEKKVAIEKKSNRDKFLKLLGKAYLERIKDAKDSNGLLHNKEWKKDSLQKLSKLLTANEKVWFQKKIDEDVFTL